MEASRRFLIIGGGSMGKRRIRCLLANGVPAENIRLIDRREDRRSESLAKYDVRSFLDREAGWAWQPDVIIVSTPTTYHLPYCLEAARAGKDLFCEIALSDSLDGADELLALVEEKQLVAAFGINNPFHFVMRKATAWLRDGSLGAPITYQLSYGNYLPNWHPWEDYQDFYDETQIMGVIAQELATMYTLLDTRLTGLYAQLQHSSSLAIDGPDNIQILARTAEGSSVAMQIDLLQDNQKYEYRIVCEQGVIEAGLLPQAYASRYFNATKQIEVVHPPPAYTFEQCYIDEFGHFLETLDTRQAWYHPIGDAVQILRCLEAVKHSNRSGQMIAIDDRGIRT